MQLFLSEFKMNSNGKRNRDNAFDGISQSNALSLLRLALKSIADFTLFLLLFFKTITTNILPN